MTTTNKAEILRSAANILRSFLDDFELMSTFANEIRMERTITLLNEIADTLANPARMKRRPPVRRLITPQMLAMGESMSLSIAPDKSLCLRVTGDGALNVQGSHVLTIYPLHSNSFDVRFPRKHMQPYALESMPPLGTESPQAILESAIIKPLTQRDSPGVRIAKSLGIPEITREIRSPKSEAAFIERELEAAGVARTLQPGWKRMDGIAEDDECSYVHRGSQQQCLLPLGHSERHSTVRPSDVPIKPARTCLCEPDGQGIASNCPVHPMRARKPKPGTKDWQRQQVSEIRKWARKPAKKISVAQRAARRKK